MTDNKDLDEELAAYNQSLEAKSVNQDITPEQISEAITYLEAASSRDISQVTTLSDSAQLIGDTGKHIHTLLSMYGEPGEFEYEAHELLGGKLIVKRLGIDKSSDDYRIKASTTGSTVYLQTFSKSNGRDIHEYDIAIPVNKKITPSGDKIHDQLLVTGFDRRMKSAGVYYPVQESLSPSVQQGFGKIFQESLKVFLKAVPRTS